MSCLSVNKVISLTIRASIASTKYSNIILRASFNYLTRGTKGTRIIIEKKVVFINCSYNGEN